MVAFWGRISDEGLSHVFKFEDRDFLNRVKIILEDEYTNAQFQYRTNADIATIFLAWCFELESKDMMEWLIRNYVKEEWCVGLERFMGMARDGEGFVFPGGVWLHVS